MTAKKLTSMLCALALVLSLFAPGGLVTPAAAAQTTDWTGLKVSVLGDSISTYEGWSNNPAYNTTLSSNLVFFPQAGANFDVDGTWWKQVIDHAGMELLVNNSFSGDELNPEQSPGKGLERCVQLHNGEQLPDVIFVYFGTNDAGNEDDTEVFRGHYTTMMSSIAQSYPEAQVFFFTLLPRFNKTVPPYSTVIRELVSGSGNAKFHLVDLEQDSGITLDNLQQVTIDNLHPNYKGMDMISNALLDVMGLEPLATDPVTTPAHTHTCTHDHVDENAVWSSLNDVAAKANGSNFAIPNGHYYLEADLTLSGSQQILVQGARDTTICLNGHDIVAGSSASYIFYYGANDYTPKCTLNICDCAGTGKIRGLDGGTAFYHGAFSVNKGGTLNLYGGTITGNTTSNTVCVLGAATFNMYGGAITKNENSLNGAVYVKNSTFNMYGGQIADNKVPDGKTQITNEGGTVTNNGGTVTENRLKVLSIGNSYSADSLNYLPQIAEAYGQEIDVGFLVQSSGSLSNHVQNIQNSSASYIWYTYINGTWARAADKVSLYDGLTAQDWDVIVLQQRSLTSGVVSSYNDDLTTLVEYVNNNKTNADAKLWWHMTWAYANGYSNADFASYYQSDSDLMYESIVTAVNSKIVPQLGENSTFEVLIPTGTTIQNARTADGSRTFSRDGTHMNTLGRVMASYTWYAKLFGVDELDELAVTSVSASFDEKTAAYTMTEADKTLVLNAVNDALVKPYGDVTVDTSTHIHTCSHGHAAITGEWIPLSTKTNGMSESIGLPAGNYYLDKDIQLVGGYLSVGGDINLCLNGHKLIGANNIGYILHIANTSATANNGNGFQLNICDCSTAQTGTIGNYSTSTASSASTYGAIIARKNGDVNIYSGKITGVSAYNIIYIASGSSVTLYGGELSGNSTNHGVHIASGGTFVMEGGVIANNTTRYNGAVHVASGGSFTMNGGVIAGNTVTSGKAPVTGTYTQNGGTITEDAYSPHTHTELTHVPAVANDCDKDGNIEYWSCSCGKYFSDNAAAHEITDKTTVVIPAAHDIINHDGQSAAPGIAGWNAYQTCSRCDYSTYTEIPALEIGADQTVKVETFKEAGKTPVSEEGFFAGYYADAAHTTAHTADSGDAYVKFVARDVLSVKGQLAVGTTAQSEKTDLRLLTTVDDLNYRQIGFKITVGGRTVTVSTNKVFERIVANEGGVAYDKTPSVFHEQSGYFMTYTITDIPADVFGTTITVVPYWVTLDGTEQEGRALTFTIAEVINGEF